jgi:hypothetical protein
MELLNINDAVHFVVAGSASWSSLVRPTEASRCGEERGAERPRDTHSLSSGSETFLGIARFRT